MCFAKLILFSVKSVNSHNYMNTVLLDPSIIRLSWWRDAVWNCKAPEGAGNGKGVAGNGMGL